jgi:hypothetical protein
MASSPESPSRPLRQILTPLGAGALAGLALRLLAGPQGSPLGPMLGSFFLLAPVLVAAITVYVAERGGRRSWGYYFLAGAGANALFVLGTFLVLIEGFVCVILALPVFCLVGGLAGLGVGALCRLTNMSGGVVSCLAVLPLLTSGVEQSLPMPQEVHTVERSRLVPARPEQIWPHLLTASNIRPEELNEAWMYRIGVPLPLSATSEIIDGRLVRHIRMGKDIHFDQIAAEWEPNVRVRWLYRFTAGSFPPQALDDHVRIGGPHFDLIDTEYTLTPVPGGTALRARMTYRVRTGFNWYAAPIAAFLASNFEEAALRFYARRAAAGSAVRTEAPAGT